MCYFAFLLHIIYCNNIILQLSSNERETEPETDVLPDQFVHPHYLLTDHQHHTALSVKQHIKEEQKVWFLDKQMLL